MKKLHLQSKPGHMQQAPAAPNPLRGNRAPLLDKGEGDTVDGRYRLIRKIGEGGIGNVFIAEEMASGREVALKLRKKEVPLESGPKRITQEIQALRKVNHENIVGLVDAGVDEGDSFMVMERLDGMDLSDFIMKTGILDPIAAAYIVIEVCKAVAALHGQGILHMDIKPSNIFLRNEGRVTVTDFDVASYDSKSREPSDDMKGTPGYMSPEAFGGCPIDERSDVFSLGATLHRILSRIGPFDRESELSTICATLNAEPAPLEREFALSPVPEQLERVILRALAKDPENRFQSISEMQKAIENVYGNLGFMAERLSACVRAVRIQEEFEQNPMCHEAATVDRGAQTA